MLVLTLLLNGGLNQRMLRSQFLLWPVLGGHTLNKIFNRNTIKISYSCKSNVKQLIDSHNKRLLAAYIPSLESAKTKLCNYRKKASAP